MTDEQVQEMNEFFSQRVPGILGVETTEISPNQVVGKMDVSATLIAGTGYLFAPAVVALADTLAAIGVGASRPEGSQSFTTIGPVTSTFDSSGGVWNTRTSGRAAMGG